VIYPWQLEQWQSVLERLEAGTLPHALMLTGPRGLGKTEFGRELAKTALCQEPGENGSCGACQACQLFEAGTHPDIKMLTPEEPAKQIRVDDVRALIEFTNLSTQYGQHKVALVFPADALNMSSANSLLKTLEEPPPGTLLILVTDQPSRLPVTIRSRCQDILFGIPAVSEAEAWLEAQPDVHGYSVSTLLAIANGAPLTARDDLDEETLKARTRLFQDLLEALRGKLALVEFSSRYEKNLGPVYTSWLNGWVHDLIRLKMLGEDTPVANPDIIEDLRRLSKVLDLKALFGLQDKLYKLMHFQGRVNLNTQMALEELLIDWRSALRLNKR
jgi:DNA polymerase-3 subunit delta'